MSDDVLITPASRKIEFKDSSGNIDGKIELDGSGNLQITSTGLIGIGDTSEDIHIGDGTQAVDLVFDYASSIYSVANQDLTIGKKSLGGNDIVIDTPSYLSITTSAGYMNIGSQNSSWAHFYTNRPKYYFNKGVIVDEGIIGSYNEDLKLVTDQNEVRVTIMADDGAVGFGETDPIGRLEIKDGGHNMIHLNRTVDNEGWGAGIIGKLGNDSSTTAAHQYAGMFFQIEDNTDGSEKGSIALHTSSGGVAADQGGSHAVQITSNGDIVAGATTCSVTTSNHKTIEVCGSTQANFRATDTSGALHTDFAHSANDTWIVNRVAAGKIFIKPGNGDDSIELASDGQVKFNDAYTFPTSDGSANQVLQTNGSGALSFATVSGGGSIDADTNLANNPVWTVTSTSGIGLYIVRDKDDANSDKEVVRIRDDNADTDRPALWLISDGGAQMGTNASGITPTCAISAGYQGATWPLHIQNGSNVGSTPYPAVGAKWKISGWGNQDESDKWSGILVSSQAQWGVKHKMDFYIQADTSASGGVNSPVVAMTIKHDQEIDGNFNDTSDISLKSNIISIPNGLDMIEKLNPVTFNWDRHGNNKPSAGFIAQEVEEVLPDLVRGEEGDKTIKTAGIVGYLVKAVQELSARVKELEGGN